MSKKVVLATDKNTKMLQSLQMENIQLQNAELRAENQKRFAENHKNQIKDYISHRTLTELSEELSIAEDNIMHVNPFYRIENKNLRLFANIASWCIIILLFLAPVPVNYAALAMLTTMIIFILRGKKCHTKISFLKECVEAKKLEIAKEEKQMITTKCSACGAQNNVLMGTSTPCEFCGTIIHLS